MKRFNVLNSFTLKIIAMVTMAFDHIGVTVMTLWGLSASHPAIMTLRILGRIAMPLYCFMLVEGVIHTRSYKKYALKLGIMAVLISIFLAVTYYVPDLKQYNLAGFGNIFLDLFLGSLMIFTLRQKNNYIKLIALIPLAISILSFSVKCYEYAMSCHQAGCDYGITVAWYPKYLRLQYDWLSLALMLGYFLSYYGAKLYYKIREESYGISEESVEGTNEMRIATNLIAVFFTILFAFLYYLFKYFNESIVWWNANLQIGMLLAIIPIALYSGMRGYNKKWFNIFSYLYYPVHIILIVGICYLIYIV